MKLTTIVALMGLGAGLSFAESSAPISSSVAAAPEKAASEINIGKIAVGTAVEQRELSGAATEFDASVGRVYCWTKYSGVTPPVDLKHVWYVDGKKEAEVILSAKTESGRTWSSKSVWPGKWKVEVLGPSGDGEISSVEFVVK